MREFVLALASQIVFVGAIFGGAYLLFTTLRFDLAVALSGLGVAALVLFIYWPRRRP